MTVTDKTADARLRGWIEAGIVEVREENGEKKYYLKTPCIEVVGFGRIYISDDTIDIQILPSFKMLSMVRRGEAKIIPLEVDDCAGGGNSR